ncbi:MAG: methionine--tRNA ligase subunit beta [Candidatus Omnitrophica bacterium]|nr:methionine--tRNA ligase subunit beta [Candidatus Omnitrophota bacterium]MDD5488813.1 methionine--tRNA ligase subunit beta [Candidatus Omnitrophota bacterium]
MVSFEDFKKLDLRIARVVEVKEHPNADKLYVLSVDTGEETKQIVAGIRASYAVEELVGKSIVVVNNLEPAVIRGESSNGMLLAASSENGPVILAPEKEVMPGAQVR